VGSVKEESMIEIFMFIAGFGFGVAFTIIDWYRR